MTKFLKQLFCRHNYVKIRNRHYKKHKGFIIVQGVFKCPKCGKMKYRE